MAAKNLHKFEGLFRELFKPLCGFAMKFTGDLDDAKNLVHEVLIQLWEKFDSLPEDTNYKSYCYTAVRNKCLNYIRDRKKFVILSNVAEDQMIQTNTALETAELQQKIEGAIASLPEKCRTIFELNRIEGLKYAQIAEKLNISIKTVEAQMSKALGVMKEHLKEFLSIFFMLWP
ncbi:MAG: RNA polymerase sigma-70 factor [Cyclobacteriaceae bacterium]